MEAFIVRLYIAVLLVDCHAQGGTWVRMNGSDTACSPGHYKTKGVPSVNNSPPALYQTVQWTDREGNFWIFGGLSQDRQEPGQYSDLWKYDPIANIWTWIKGRGTSNTPGVYGTLGVPSITNTPGARAWGVSSCADNSADL